MSNFDWTKVLPVIGAAVTGNVPGAILAAADAIGDALGAPVPATPDGIIQALQAATPEQVIALQKIDADLKLRFRELDTEDKKTVQAGELAVLSDVQDARKFNSNTHGILYLGYAINTMSYLCIFGVLAGCFWVMGSSGRLAIDPGVAAMLGGVIGAAVQWLMSNAAQANAFFFGSSPGSRQVSADLARAVGDVASKAR